jgi:hypothetical protein
MVLVGPVELLQATMPTVNRLPTGPKSIEKLLDAGTLNVIAGTAASAGNDAASCIWMNWELVLLLYPESPYSVPGEALITLLAAYAAVELLLIGI